MRRTLPTLLLLACLTVPAVGQQKSISFINDVAPIFKESCFACHDSKKRNGKFDMTTFEKLMAGGNNGEQIVPGKPEESDLYELLVTKEERRMPPRDKGEAVSKEKAAIIERWIREGAKLDPGIAPTADLMKELRLRRTPPSAPIAYRFPTIVNALTFTPDGRHLVISGHHELTIWTTTDAKLVKRIATRAERAYALAFLPDGTLAVAAGSPGQEGDVRLFDINVKGTIKDGIEYLDGVKDSAVMKKQLLDAEDSVLCLAVSADGKRLAAGGCDRTIRVWSIPEYTLEQTIENHADWVLALAFSADGKYLVSGGRDKTAKVWDLVAKESVVTFPQHQNIVYGVALSADGKTAYSVGADRSLRTWETKGDAKQIRSNGGHGDDVLKLVAHPKEALFVTCSADKSVRVWDAVKGSNVRTMQDFKDHVFAVAISPDGKTIAAGAFDGEVKLFATADGKPILSFNASPGLTTSAK